MSADLPAEVAALKLPDIDWDILLSAGEWFAARTETKIDDAFVAFLRTVKEDPKVGGWFASKVAADDAGVLRLVHGDEVPAEVAQALFDGGVFKNAKDLAEVVAALKEFLPYALELLKLIRLFTGK